MGRLGFVLIAWAVAGTAQAQTLADVTAAEHALTDANDRTPLTIGFASLVDAKAPLYGDYAARTSSHYKMGETIFFYVEPLGLKHHPTDALISCGLSMDLLVKRDGIIVFGKEAFISADFPSHHAVQEVMLNGDLTVNAPPSAYEIELVVHDHTSGEVTRATLPFVIDDQDGGEKAK